MSRDLHLEVRVQNAKGLVRRLAQLVELVDEGLTDAEIHERFGDGWSETTVKRYRLVLQLQRRPQGRRGAGNGRWRDAR